MIAIKTVRNDVKLLFTILKFFLLYPSQKVVAVMVVAEFESQHRNRHAMTLIRVYLDNL